MGQDIKVLAYNTLIERYNTWKKEEEDKLERILVLEAYEEIQDEIKKVADINLGIVKEDRNKEANIIRSKIGKYKRHIIELEKSKERYLGITE